MEQANKCVLITGSSRGIGLGIARGFAAAGYGKIVINGRQDKTQLEQSGLEIRTDYPGTSVMEICADLSDYSVAEKLLESVTDEYGTVDVLVNNAGTAYFGLFNEMKPHEIGSTISDNLHTMLNMSHLVIPAMIRAKAGCIINITSVWGLTGASCEAVYSAAKAGAIGLTKALAKELAPSGIRVNAIACGAFDTRMNERLEDEEKNAFIENIPMGRFGMPNEAGDLAVYLASDKARYLTGQVIGLDGGL